MGDNVSVDIMLFTWAANAVKYCSINANIVESITIYECIFYEALVVWIIAVVIYQNDISTRPRLINDNNDDDAIFGGVGLKKKGLRCACVCIDERWNICLRPPAWLIKFNSPLMLNCYKHAVCTYRVAFAISQPSVYLTRRFCDALQTSLQIALFGTLKDNSIPCLLQNHRQTKYFHAVFKGASLP